MNNPDDKKPPVDDGAPSAQEEGSEPPDSVAGNVSEETSATANPLFSPAEAHDVVETISGAFDIVPLEQWSTPQTNGESEIPDIVGGLSEAFDAMTDGGAETTTDETEVPQNELSPDQAAAEEEAGEAPEPVVEALEAPEPVVEASQAPEPDPIQEAKTPFWSIVAEMEVEDEVEPTVATVRPQRRPTQLVPVLVIIVILVVAVSLVFVIARGGLSDRGRSAHTTVDTPAQQQPDAGQQAIVSPSTQGPENPEGVALASADAVDPDASHDEVQSNDATEAESTDETPVTDIQATETTEPEVNGQPDAALVPPDVAAQPEAIPDAQESDPTLGIPPTAPANGQTIRLNLSSSPGGVRVYHGDALLGRTPIDQVESGSAILEVELRKTDFVPLRVRIPVGSEPCLVHVELDSTSESPTVELDALVRTHIEVTSTPSLARVYINEMHVGRTPFVSDFCADAADLQVMLRKSDYLTFRQQITAGSEVPPISVPLIPE